MKGREQTMKSTEKTMARGAQEIVRIKSENCVGAKLDENEKNRIPLVEKVVNLLYTKGLYKFYCQTTLKLFLIAIAILENVHDFSEKIKACDYKKLVACLWIVNHNSNKLEGICSISSSVWDNLFCKCRRILENCICKFCYAHNQQAYQDGLREHNIVNGIVLRNILIPVSAFKQLVIIFPYLRIESFGDVANVIQARNYLRIIKAFPRKRCAIWSKNIEIWKQAFELEGKPANTTYVHSSRELNKPDEINLEKYDFIDHIFTVYTKAYAKKHNIVINCGGRKCMDCIRKRINCYYRNTEFYINELKK